MPPETMFTSRDVAVVIPTMNRPASLAKLLESLAQQSSPPGRILVADGGEGIDGVVSQYAGRLPIEHLRCQPPGQIRQRNMAYAVLNDSTRLVALLDDDLVMEATALEAMVAFWNTLDDRTGGVSFNIVNNPPFVPSRAKALVGMSAPRMGVILKSGYNVAISPTPTNIEVEWLCGGATVWRQDILTTYRHTEIKSRWAICEDISYSYPIRKQFRLFVCADAKVLHEHVYDHTKTLDHRYYGRTVTLWRMHFVNNNPNLSKVQCVGMLCAQAVTRMAIGIIRRRSSDWNYGIGQFQGLRLGCVPFAAGRSLVALLEA